MNFGMPVRDFVGTLDEGMNTFDVSGTLTLFGAETGQLLFTQGFTAHGDRMVIP